MRRPTRAELQADLDNNPGRNNYPSGDWECPICEGAVQSCPHVTPDLQEWLDEHPAPDPWFSECEPMSLVEPSIFTPNPFATGPTLDGRPIGVNTGAHQIEFPSVRPVAVDATGLPTRHGAAHLPGLGDDPAARKAAPMARGLLDYFPNALALVAHVSKVGNDQHNPGQPMHWAFEKSSDEADCILRHLAQRGTLDTDGLRHSGKVAWRALALLERELLEQDPTLKPGLSVKGR